MRAAIPLPYSDGICAITCVGNLPGCVVLLLVDYAPPPFSPLKTLFLVSRYFVEVLDEPAANQSDATVLELQLRAISKKQHGDVAVRFVNVNVPGFVFKEEASQKALHSLVDIV